MHDLGNPLRSASNVRIVRNSAMSLVPGQIPPASFCKEVLGISQSNGREQDSNSQSFFPTLAVNTAAPDRHGRWKRGSP